MRKQVFIVASIAASFGSIAGLSAPAGAKIVNEFEQPQGSFRQTCTGITYEVTVDYDKLSATCGDSHGGKAQSTLSNVFQCNGDIANTYGTLTCSKSMTSGKMATARTLMQPVVKKYFGFSTVPDKLLRESVLSFIYSSGSMFWYQGKLDSVNGAPLLRQAAWTSEIVTPIYLEKTKQPPSTTDIANWKKKIQGDGTKALTYKEIYDAINPIIKQSFPGYAKPVLQKVPGILQIPAAGQPKTYSFSVVNWGSLGLGTFEPYAAGKSCGGKAATTISVRFFDVDHGTLDTVCGLTQPKDLQALRFRAGNLPNLPSCVAVEITNAATGKSVTSDGVTTDGKNQPCYAMIK